MAKLGVITDGISRDFEHALRVMTEAGLEYAELQFLWNKEIGDLNDDEVARASDLVRRYGVKVSCITRHIFAGLLVMDTEIGDERYAKQMAALERCIAMAREFRTDLVRTMSYRKEMILFGLGGAEVWNVSKGAWKKFVTLMAPPMELAEKEGITLVVETGNNAIITSGQLGRRLIDELGTSRLKVLWDPANSLFCNEPAHPDGYQALRGGYLGHIHMKDARVDIPNATVEQCELGSGEMTPFLEPLAQSLRQDGYDGVISLESVYRPPGLDFEDGFKASVGRFKEIFG